MPTDKRSGWLAELKPGDEVAVLARTLGPGVYHFYKIKRITPAGKIICDQNSSSEIVFDEKGLGPRVSSYTPREQLLQVTESLLADDARKKLRAAVSMFLDFSRISSCKLSELTDVQLEQLLGLLRSLEVDKSSGR